MNDIEIGLQLPQAVDNSPTKDVIAPEDEEAAIISKCTVAITKEVQRVLFNLFGDIDIKTKNFKFLSEGYPEEDVAELKLRLAAVLSELKTAIFRANAIIEEQDTEYIVKGIIDGPNMQELKKFVGTLKILKTVDGLRAKTSREVANLDLVIEKSSKVVASTPEGQELSKKDQLKVTNAQETVADRTPKLEQKQLAYEEITSFLDEFMQIKTIDVDKFWEGSQTLVDKLDKDNYLDEKEKAQLTNLKKFCAELKAECAIPKGKEPQANPEPAVAKKRRFVLYIAFGVYVFSTLLAAGTTILNKCYPHKKTQRDATELNYKTAHARLKTEAQRLLTTKSHVYKQLVEAKNEMVENLADVNIKKIPENATRKEVVKTTANKIFTALKLMMKVPFEHPLMKPEQLSGKVPVLIFADKYKGQKFTAEVRVTKYHVKPVQQKDLTKDIKASYKGKRVNATTAERKYIAIITFSEPFKAHTVKLTDQLMVKYFQEKAFK